MPDISMCANRECPKRLECYRYTAEPNPYRQSYFVGNINKEDGTCDYFWYNEGYPLGKHVNEEADTRHRNKLKSVKDLDDSNEGH